MKCATPSCQNVGQPELNGKCRSCHVFYTEIDKKPESALTDS